MVVRSQVIMASKSAVLSKSFLKVQKFAWAKGSIYEQRSRQEKSARFFRLPKSVKISHFDIEGMPAVMLNPQTAGEGVILYLHGGAYALGSIRTHIELLARLANATTLKVLGIDYCRAPEKPFPAGLEDATNAYQWLINNDFSPDRIAVAGDSSGGGLAIATMLWLRDHQVPLPACGVCISPWLDLTLSGDSIKTKASADPVLSSSLLSVYADLYAGGHKKDLPLISPLFADLNGLPPILLHSGTDEILLDDTVRFFEKANRAGVKVTLKTWDGLFHVFQMVPLLPESAQSMGLISKFIHSQFEKKNAD